MIEVTLLKLWCLNNERFADVVVVVYSSSKPHDMAVYGKNRTLLAMVTVAAGMMTSTSR